MDGAAWFDLDGGVAVPRPHAHAPWSDDMLHGRLLAGLTARAVQIDHIDPGWFPARVTIDMFRSPPMAPVVVTSERVRDGGRVRVVDVVHAAGGREVARARVLVMKGSDHAADQVWETGDWDMPRPDRLESPGGPVAGEDLWEFRAEEGGFINADGPGRGWTRDNVPLVAGEVVSPFVRVATAADLSSPIANSGPAGLEFINADITLNLARLPASEWIGFETVFHRNADGIAAASCVVHDLDGPIGLSTVSAVRTGPLRPQG